MTTGFQVTFDAHHPQELAEFWALALGYVPHPPPEGFDTWDEYADSIDMPPDERDDIAAIVDPDGEGPRILFLKVPESKTSKNRVHLDIRVSRGEDDSHERVEAHVAKLVSAGATFMRRHDERTGFWVVCQDPEGNEFCVE